MKIQWFRSATVGIQTNSGVSILCDPWITDGAFIGSWYHWPPLEGNEFTRIIENKWDYIYISHLHADHFDRKLVSKIAKVQPKCIAIIPKFETDWLRRAVENCGFTSNRLIELESGKKNNLNDLEATIYVADFCDHKICGVEIPCFSKNPGRRSIDSVAIFKSDNQTILNANDALAVNSAKRLWPIIGNVDLILGHYGGAGPFPQCFTELENFKKIELARENAMNFVERLIDTSNFLNAKYVMPYAGQYVLGGKLANLNEFRSVMKLSEVINLISSKSNSIPVSLAPFSQFDLDTGKSTKEWSEPSREIYNAYIERISVNLFPYENSKKTWSRESEEQNMKIAFKKLQRQFKTDLDAGVIGSNSTLSIETELGIYNFNFSESECYFSQADEDVFAQRTIVGLNSSLLEKLIIRRPGYNGFTQYHFNQAEIGSHLTWKREGSYFREIELLNFLQIEKYSKLQN